MAGETNIRYDTILRPPQLSDAEKVAVELRRQRQMGGRTLTRATRRTTRTLFGRSRFGKWLSQKIVWGGSGFPLNKVSEPAKTPVLTTSDTRRK